VALANEFLLNEIIRAEERLDPCMNKRAMIAHAAAIALTTASAPAPALAAGWDVNATIMGLALRGYDPVAYFTDGKPVLGDFTITAQYKEAT
jgi:hypothetical protein